MSASSAAPSKQIRHTSSSSSSSSAWSSAGLVIVRGDAASAGASQGLHSIISSSLPSRFVTLRGRALLSIELS